MILKNSLKNNSSVDSEELINILGDGNVATDEFTRTLYSYDLAPIPDFVKSFFKTTPDTVVRPETTEQVSEIVKYAYKKRVPLTPRGSACSGYGGAIPVKGGIVLDMSKMDKILEIDEDQKIVTVQAGIFYQSLMNLLERKGLTLLTHPSSAPVSTVAGWICTGGLGIGSLKYGHISKQIIELEAVLPDGEIVQLSKRQPREKGIHLNWLMGSEGILGIITKVKLHIKPLPEFVSSHGIYFEKFEQLNNAILSITKSQYLPYSIEYFDKEFLDIKRSLDLFAPEAGAYTVLAFEGQKEEVQRSKKFLEQVNKKNGGSEIDKEKAKEEWEDRFFPLRIGRAGPTLVPGDIIIPLSSLQEFVYNIWHMKKKYQVSLGIYGSVVSREETTIMPMALADERKSVSYLSILPILRDLTELGIKKGGKPYGIGLWNSFYLNEIYDETFVEDLRRRKRLLDPNKIMNPGKFFYAKTRFGFILPPFLFGTVMSLFKLLRFFG